VFILQKNVCLVVVAALHEFLCDILNAIYCDIVLLDLFSYVLTAEIPHQMV
jgi:hypothetical protein